MTEIGINLKMVKKNLEDGSMGKNICCESKNWIQVPSTQVKASVGVSQPA